VGGVLSALLSLAVGSSGLGNVDLRDRETDRCQYDGLRERRAQLDDKAAGESFRRRRRVEGGARAAVERRDAFNNPREDAGWSIDKVATRGRRVAGRMCPRAKEGKGLRVLTMTRHVVTGPVPTLSAQPAAA
jgi:hypothetical protein